MIEKYKKPLAAVTAAAALGAAATARSANAQPASPNSHNLTVHVDKKPKPPKPKSAEEITKLKQKLAHEQAELKRVSDIASRLIGVSRGELSGDGLLSPDQLPGRNMKISPEIRREVSESALLLIKRAKPQINKGGDQNWMPICTTNRISYKGNDNLATVAGHCLRADSNIGNSTYDVWPYQNIADTSNDEYALASITDPLTPIASVENIAMSPDDANDAALLEVEPIVGKDPGHGFESVTPIDMDAHHKAPILGEPVAIYSFPDAAGYSPVTATGVYLGTAYVPNPANKIQRVYVVGINPKDPSNDGCNYRASGNNAKSASGFNFLELSMRNNVGYEDGQPNPSGTDVPTLGEKFRLDTLERALGIRLDGFSTLCIYQVFDHVPTNSQRDTMDGLIKGFLHRAVPNWITNVPGNATPGK